MGPPLLELLDFFVFRTVWTGHPSKYIETKGPPKIEKTMARWLASRKNAFGAPACQPARASDPPSRGITRRQVRIFHDIGRAALTIAIETAYLRCAGPSEANA